MLNMYKNVISALEPQKIKYNELMKNHTTFRIGGPADLLVLPESIDDLQKIIKICKKDNIDYIIIGMGSNILVSDSGYRGVVIKLASQFKKCQINFEMIESEAGIRLAELAKKAAADSLSGLEFSEGIPGSLGGGIFMNAGAYGAEIQDVITEVKAVNPADGSIHVFQKEDLNFGYRHSVFQKNGFIIYSARLALKKGNRDEIYALMKTYSSSRREKQPLEYPSAGSTFKRPEGHYVGPMIQELGLKGFAIGDAQVSEKHAGFIINRGNATAQDVVNLIKYIQQKIYEKYQIKLEPELRFIGKF